jgi:glycosyltransferase involved in cell wall biosynthesis
MKLLIVTQAVDTEDPVLGFFVRWIEELAKRVEHIEVICLKEGKHVLPANVRVHSLGKERGAQSRATYALRFLRLVWALRRDYDAVFVHMNPEYLILAGPIWKLLDKRVCLWYNHPADNLRLRFAIAFAYKLFYTSPYAATANSSKAEQMPVGIDTELFVSQPVARNRATIYLQGRVMPSKRVETALDALRILHEQIPEASLTIVGPEELTYAVELKNRFADLIEKSAATFLGPRKNNETPALYSAHGAAINLAASGHFDKTAFEAMACETPVIVSSRAFAGLVRGEWVVSEKNPQALAEALARLIRLPEEEYAALGAAERATVVARHSLTSLIEALLRAI